MNNQNKKGGISWTDYTWNPIGGCKHGCDYCYMLRMGKRFPHLLEPHFKPHILREPIKLKKPSKIFVGSSGDMWGDWVNPAWIQIVLDACREAPQHTFQFLTKNPKRYADFDLPENGWYGTTIDGTDRTKYFDEYLFTAVGRDRLKFISCEPLLQYVVPDLKGIEWVIIGADSNKGAKKPLNYWADKIIFEARTWGTAIWMKDNYGYHTRLKEFPE